MSQACPELVEGNRKVYKAQSPGKLARHNNAPDSGDAVNAAVASRMFTFLSGEICSISIRLVSLLFGSLNAAQIERPGQATEPYRTLEAIVAKCLLQ
ncbi:MAG TPA: hypothetical protein DEO88_17305 [Syntrophobacteraceae bacterium]|nr:hypothetical protein [Syntrophobacteraceae bacterium]